MKIYNLYKIKYWKIVYWRQESRLRILFYGIIDTKKHEIKREKVLKNGDKTIR